MNEVKMQLSEQEVWRPVFGYEGLYEVSSLGNIRSVDRERDHGFGNATRTLKGRPIKGWINSKGYKIVALSLDGVVANRSIHSMVCDAFHPTSRNRECTNHLDGNKLNNRPDNIEPSTYSKNNAHAYRTGLKPPVVNAGEKCGTAKLNNAIVLQIRQAAALGESGLSIANRFGIHHSTACRVAKGKTWKHLLP